MYFLIMLTKYHKKYIESCKNAAQNKKGGDKKIKRNITRWVNIFVNIIRIFLLLHENEWSAFLKYGIFVVFVAEKGSVVEKFQS